MSNSNQQDGPAIGGRGPKPGGKSADFGSVGKTAKGVLAKTSNVAGERVSTIAGQVKGQVTEMLDRQVHGGGDVVGHFAVSARRAADDLEGDAPQIASLVRTFAGRAEGYAADLRNQSTEQLVGTVSDFTRRQPALVFGMAALAGFLTFRALKNAAPAGPSTGDGSRRAADDGSGRGAV